MTPAMLLRWQPNGPFITCRACGKTVSRNALARASHERACLDSHAARSAAEAGVDHGRFWRAVVKAWRRAAIAELPTQPRD